MLMKKYTFLFVVLLLCGCNTYHLSTESLVKQVADVKTETRRSTRIVPVPIFTSLNPATLLLGAALTVPFFLIPANVDTLYILRNITLQDKKGREHTIPVNDRTGIKITQKSGKHTTFYLNTLKVKDSGITGQKTHFFKTYIKPIPIDSISKIEVQK